MLFACLGAFLFMAGAIRFLVFVIPGIITFGALLVIKEKARPAVFGAAVLIIAAAALALVIPEFSHVRDGIALLMNQLFAIAEREQAYVYNRMGTSDGATDSLTCIRNAVLWAGCAAGMLLSLPGRDERRKICVAVFIAACAVFAYFGLMPNAWCIAAMAVCMTVAAGRGRLAALIPVLLICALIFGAVMAADPGESVPVSRSDESARDLLAVRTVRLEGLQSKSADAEKEKQEKKDKGGEGSDENKDKAASDRRMMIVLLLVLITLLILFVPSVIHDRLEKKRKKNREGIDSDDPATAVRAMFPYAVRWLGAYGLGGRDRLFSAYTEEAEKEISYSYARQYEKMLELWNEAAFSDHEITAGRCEEMRSFMDMTVKMTKEKISRKEKAKVRFRLAL